MNNDPYLEVWNYDMTSKVNQLKYGHLVDKTKEAQIEKEISAYIRNKFYFVALTVNPKEQRLELAEKLIGTVSNCHTCKPSRASLGNNSPLSQIRNSGLWLVNGLCASPLTEDELKIIENALVK